MDYLLGYARIILAFVGLYYSPIDPVLTLAIWILLALLDLMDGMLARALDQCSSLGVLLDIAADNLLRTTTCIAAAAASSQTNNKEDSSDSDSEYDYSYQYWLPRGCKFGHFVGMDDHGVYPIACGPVRNALEGITRK